MKLCLGCMNHIDDNETRCSNCGFSLEDKVAFNALKPETKLANRFIVGKVKNIDGEGITYIAFDTENTKPVTIKEYLPQGLAKRVDDKLEINPGCETKYKNLRSDFIELYKTLKSKSDIDNIIHVKALFTEYQFVYAVFDYVQGVSLGNYLLNKQSLLTWGETKGLIIPILKSMIELNKAGIVHRGLSPKTLVLTNDENILKITGFSICSLRVRNSEIPSELFEGFAAFEQYSKNIPHGEWTDVYALCSIMYKMLTGVTLEAPMLRDDSEDAQSPRTLNDTIDPFSANVIVRGLDVHIKNRIKTVEQLVEEFISAENKNVEKTITAETVPLSKIIDIAVSEISEPTRENEKIIIEKVETIEPTHTAHTSHTTQSNYDNSYNNSSNQKKVQEKIDEAMRDEVKKEMYIENSNKYQQNLQDLRKEQRKSNKKKKKVTLPIWFIVLLCGLPLVAVMTMFFYSVMMGFDNSIFGNSNKIPSYSDKVSSATDTNNSSSDISNTTSDTSSEDEKDLFTVPNFVDKEYIDVIDNPEYFGVFNIRPVFNYSDTVRNGYVISQTVASKTEVEPGTSIQLSVSKGKQNITVPELGTISYDQLVDYFNHDYGIPTIKATEPSDTIPFGEVIRIIGAVPGTLLDREKAKSITIYVSSGKLPE